MSTPRRVFGRNSTCSWISVYKRYRPPKSSPIIIGRKRLTATRDPGSVGDDVLEDGEADPAVPLGDQPDEPPDSAALVMSARMGRAEIARVRRRRRTNTKRIPRMGTTSDSNSGIPVA